MKLQVLKCLRAAVLGILLLVAPRAFADTEYLFDFNPLSPGYQSGPAADPIESYMESIYGSDISVDVGARTANQGIKVKRKWTHLGISDGAYARQSLSKKALRLRSYDTFLLSAGDKKSTVQPHIVLDFNNQPIKSFQFDFEIYAGKKKLPSGLIVKADGVTVFEYDLSKAQRKAGYLGHQGLYVFGTPVETLEFIGMPRSGIGIDNLLVNIEDPNTANGLSGSIFSGTGGLSGNDDSNSDSNTSPGLLGDNGGSGLGDPPIGILQTVPEPGSLFLVGVGLIGIFSWKYRQAHP